MYSFSEDQTAVRKMINEFAEKYVRPEVRLRDRQAKYPEEIIGLLSEHGYKGANIPEQYGGAGLDPVSAVLLVNGISRVDSSLGHILEVNNYGFCEPILTFGTEEQKEKYLPEFTTGKSVGGFAYTEAGGSDPSNVNLTALEKDGAYILNGSKIMVTNARYSASMLVVGRTAKTENLFYGLTFFIVDMNKAGITVGKTEDTMGQRSIEMCEVSFENCIVEKDRVLGNVNEGFKVLMTLMNKMRISVSAMALGIAEAALEEAMKFANVPYRDGKPLYEIPSVKNYISEMVSHINIMKLLVYSAAETIKEDNPETRLKSLNTKLTVCEYAKDICDKALQIHGGCGFISDYDIERLYRDVRATTIFGLTSERAKSSIADMFIKRYLENGDI